MIFLVSTFNLRNFVYETIASFSVTVFGSALHLGV